MPFIYQRWLCFSNVLTNFCRNVTLFFYSDLMINIGEYLSRYLHPRICCLFCLCTKTFNCSFHTFCSFCFYILLKTVFLRIHLTNTCWTLIMCSYFIFFTLSVSETILEYFHFHNWLISTSHHLKIQYFIKLYKYLQGLDCVFFCFSGCLFLTLVSSAATANFKTFVHLSVFHISW